MSTKGARSALISRVGGEAWSALLEPSDQAVLFGELFTAKERILIKEVLESAVISFSIRDTFQIGVRTMWQPDCEIKGRHRTGRFITLLHSFSGRLTTSWTWSKLARPLYERGFNILMLDFPGFGRSTINLESACPVKDWFQNDWHIVTQLLQELRISETHFVAVGESCATLLKMMQRSKNQVCKEHFMFNPVIDLHDIFADLSSQSDPHVGGHGRSDAHEAAADSMSKLLSSTQARLWITYNQDGIKDWFSTLAIMKDLINKGRGVGNRLKLSEVSIEDICTAKIGAELPTSFLVLSRDLKSFIADFFHKTAARSSSFNAYVPMPEFICYRTKTGTTEKEIEVDNPLSWGFAPGPMSQGWSHAKCAGLPHELSTMSLQSRAATAASAGSIPSVHLGALSPVSTGAGMHAARSIRTAGEVPDFRRITSAVSLASTVADRGSTAPPPIMLTKSTASIGASRKAAQDLLLKDPMSLRQEILKHVPLKDKEKLKERRDALAYDYEEKDREAAAQGRDVQGTAASAKTKDKPDTAKGPQTRPERSPSGFAGIRKDRGDSNLGISRSEKHSAPRGGSKELLALAA